MSNAFCDECGSEMKARRYYTPIYRGMVTTPEKVSCVMYICVKCYKATWCPK